MADNHTPEIRSYNMSQIKSKDTSIEMIVRRYLFSKGFRFRKNDTRYPGKPDIVLPKYHTVIFIHGCFWHRHTDCRYATTPGTNAEYWQIKFDRNVAKDKKNSDALEKMGWHVIGIWECELKKDLFDETMERVINKICSFYAKMTPLESKLDHDEYGFR